MSVHSAEAVFANRHDRRFGTAVQCFADAIAQVTDSPPGLIDGMHEIRRVLGAIGDTPR